MITRRNVTVPIYGYKLTIVIFDKWEEVSHMFDGGPEPRAITDIWYGKALVAVNSKEETSIIHESEHIKNAIWEYIGYKPQLGNDEVDAYLLAYIYKKIKEVFIKHDKGS